MKKISSRIEDFKIEIINEGELLRVEISDNIPIKEYVEKVNSDKKYDILKTISSSILLNAEIQKISKGTYYILSINGCLYNILCNDDSINIDERVKKKIDEETQKEEITEERIINFYKNNNQYRYCCLKHDKAGSTFYGKYYDKYFNYGELNFSKEDTFKEISLILNNLEESKSINNAFDINLLKRHILKDLEEDNEVIKKQ